MTNSLIRTVLCELRRMNAVLRENAEQIASLRAVTDLQFKRIAGMQAELDLLPVARKRRAMVRALLQPARPPNGEGRLDRSA